jgi:molybdenum cofactor sulfurtransferase
LWLAHAREKGWHVGIDASALAPTTRISLDQNPVDFLVISIYKITGYPTGVGALVLRKDIRRSVLSRSTFAGGTIDAVRPEDGLFRLYDNHAAYEDGTINFLSLPAVSKGLEFIKPLIPMISCRSQILIEYLWHALLDIRFDDRPATPLLEIRGPPPGPDRGATLSLLFRQPTNSQEIALAPFKFVVWAAARQNISVRG